jgi:hypothetical protein
MIKERIQDLALKEIPDPIKAYAKAVDQARLPAFSEPALSHPHNRSIIKVRDNGYIDIFTGTHQGIRIDSNEQTINVVTNNLLQHIGNGRLWASGDLKMEVNRGTHLVNHAAINVDSRGDITIRTNGNVKVLVARNVEVKAGGSVSITAKGRVSVRSDEHIGFSAPRYDFY